MCTYSMLDNMFTHLSHVLFKFKQLIIGGAWFKLIPLDYKVHVLTSSMANMPYHDACIYVYVYVSHMCTVYESMNIYR